MPSAEKVPASKSSLVSSPPVEERVSAVAIPAVVPAVEVDEVKRATEVN
jgi:hypothetical protein